MNRQAIGERLRNLRGNRSREEVAVAAKVTASAIWMYEAGQRVPNDEVKVRLSDYFGVSVYDIFFTDASTTVDFAPDNRTA
jgi:transcriptional regulator with XRE-family HTH domain